MKPLAWLSRRRIELGLFLFGVLLRLSMYWNYDPSWSYDSNLHWEVIQWIADNGKAPAAEATFESFHPPLYYAAGAWLLLHGVGRYGMAWFSIACGIVRLSVIWAGLELYVRGSRLARIMALALAAVTAASIHLDGMVYPEALHCCLDAVAMLLVPLAFRRSTMARWPIALAIGVLLGLGILTKISTIAVIAAVALAAFLESLIVRRAIVTRLCNALPWAFMLAVCLSVCGWYYARNVRAYGQPFITSFDIPSQSGLATEVEKLPFFDRRTLGYLFDWDATVYEFPYGRPGIGSPPRFLAVSIASTFVDFWDYGFQGYKKPWQIKPGREQRSHTDIKVMTLARAAVWGGTVIFVATAVAWFAAFFRLLRDRDIGRLALLLIPLLTVLASLRFTIKYPLDGIGVVKAIYMTFGAAPAYALFGVAAGWAQRKRYLWPILASLVVALWLVAAYSVYCRLGLRILPVVDP
jgi:hypothetical protein